MPADINLVQREISADWRELSSLPPLLARIYAARGVDTIDQVDYSLSNLLRPDQITHLESAAGRLADAVEHAESILIFGDYDADGATSTALCQRALGQMRHDRCDFMLPDRVVDGYGVSAAVARRIVERNPDLVITVDTGIASFEGLQILYEATIDVVVTDHHLPAGELPRAAHIVNPNAFDASAGKSLAGVGVAFYLMLALRAELRARGWFKGFAEPNLAGLLDLVAVGTVADLVPLDFTNRILVEEGTRRIRNGACAPGISRLIEVSGRNQQTLTSQDIAYSVAPRINAAGRLDDMRAGVNALLEQNPQVAADLADELDRINAYRRELQGEMAQQADSMLHDLGDLNDERLSRVLFNPDWHEGIVGIIASRIKDQSYRPSICFAAAAQDQLKGSCRSIRGVHIRDMLDLVDKVLPGVILRFGGHAMAAGLSIRDDALDEFATAFEQVLGEHADPAAFDQRVYHDGTLQASELSLQTALMIENAGPWGQRFPLPSFYGEFTTLDRRIVGERHVKFVVSPLQGGPSTDAILFYADDDQLRANPTRVGLHYELAVNRFRDQESVQLVVRHLLPLAQAESIDG
jgi:single-stranded-DNA-specific exonuclease